MIRGAAATASDAAAASAARAALEASGSAIDAIVAGFFAAAGAQPDVLLAPAVALAAGVGVGARAFDGRAIQPGRGAPRPRGFVDGQSVPEAARVAVPRSLGMLVLLHGYLGRARLRELVRPGVVAAERAGAGARAGLLREVGSLGAVALRARDVERALLGVGGAVAGGTLTAEDIAEAVPAEVEAASTVLPEGATALQAPWPVGGEARPADAIVACDGWGTIAALAYARTDDGIAVPELEIVLGRDAVPVRRGITRLAPGTPLPAAAPIAILQRSAFAAAIALTGRPKVDVSALGALLRGTALETALHDVRTQLGADAALAVVRDDRDARAVNLAAGFMAGAGSRSAGD
ncbi:hypothetical protein SOCE26_055140 [Sorangium cellulosum]|uniref:Uncharacterized protein n=1 Tax=Sorangium cellulosum TaxID=56 RepID=A0A2L0EXL3_SORCE|nr:hypothetical protein [Sorangium cellulosum]AUX44054.1 hypothetical protein SOCE26_055140 [Sorangium cellulosum]